MKNTKAITKKELVKETGAPFYTVDYLRMTGRLPIVRESPGKGIPTIFSSEAVEIVKRYLNRNKIPYEF